MFNQLRTTGTNASLQSVNTSTIKQTKTYIAAFFLTLLTTCYSQDGKISYVYTPDSVRHKEQMCIYPGGQESLMRDIASNFVAPKQAKKDNLTGKIFLQIVVDTLGRTTGKILKGLRPDVDSAAIEMTKKLKPFIPAKIDERKVPTTLTVPLKL